MADRISRWEKFLRNIGTDHRRHCAVLVVRVRNVTPGCWGLNIHLADVGGDATNTYVFNGLALVSNATVRATF